MKNTKTLIAKAVKKEINRQLKVKSHQLELLKEVNQVVTREQAIAKGMKYFFTGKPCINGHISQRTVKGVKCCECVNNRESEEVKNAEQSIDDTRHLNYISASASLIIVLLS